MFDMHLEKHWLGPTIYTWSDDECNNIRTWRQENLGACMKICEETDTCNAIIVEDANSQIICDLRACSFPVPAPCGPSCGDQDNEKRGHYRATGKKQIDI